MAFAIAPDVTSLHAAERLTVSGESFIDGCTATIGTTPAKSVEFVDATTLIVTTEIQDRTGEFGVTVTWPDLSEQAVGTLIVRDFYLRILLSAVDRAWSPRPSGVGYRVLAALAAGLERRRDVKLAVFDQLFPETADDGAGLEDWERDLALPERIDLTVTQRRARIRAKLNEQPTLAWGPLLEALTPFCLAEPTLNEVEDWDVYGDAIWTIWIEVTQADVDNPNFDWREAERTLWEAKPGFAGAWIGRRGFIPGISIPGRDVPVEV